MRIGVRATGSAPPARLASGRTGPWRREWALSPVADARASASDCVDGDLHEGGAEEGCRRPGEVSCGVGALSLCASFPGEAAAGGEPDALPTRAER